MAHSERYSNDHPEAQWYENAGLGLFVNGDASSVHGGIELGFGMMKDKPWGDREALPPEIADATEELAQGEITPEEYWDLVKDWDLSEFDPDEWLAAARRAGFEYAVFDVKHLAGFALWPSEYGEYGTPEYIDGRDVVGEFVRACRRNGLKLGFYYCAADLHHPSYPAPQEFDPFDWDSYWGFLTEKEAVEDGELERFEEYFTFVKNQITELVTDYGRIDLFWLDVPSWLWGANIDRGMDEIHSLIRTEQPHIVLGREFPGGGDFQTPENALPEAPMEGWWELCQIWAPPSWGYHEDEEYYDMNWTHEHVAKTVARGGNLLLNVSPDDTGALPEGAYDRMASLEAWMDHSGPSVKGVSRGPWPQRAEVPITRRAGTWYLHVLADHEGPITVRDVPEPEEVTQLRTDAAVPYGRSGEDIVIDTADLDRASENEVLALSWPAAEHHLL
jgi:alpha-L-fucosidase